MYFAKKSREKQKIERTEAHLPKDKLHYLERELEKALSAQVKLFFLFIQKYGFKKLNRFVTFSEYFLCK